MKKENQLKYDEWNEHLRTTKENSSYSLKRMDLLVITISSGGLYVIFETIKEFKTGGVNLDSTTFIKIAGIFFLSSIVLNFLSQLSAFYANMYEEKYIQNELELLSNEELKKGEIKAVLKVQETEDFWVKKCNTFTDIFNLISILFMVLGLTFLTAFLFTTF